MMQLQTKLAGKEACIPSRKLLDNWIRDIKDKTGLGKNKDSQGACLNSTTLNGKRFGRRVIQMRSTEGIDHLLIFGSLFQTGRIVKSRVIDQLHL
jgi:hypothetical protein